MLTLRPEVPQLSEFERAVLEGIQGIQARLEHVETRLEHVEARLEHVEARLDGMEARLGHLDTRVEHRFASTENRLEALEGVVADLDIRLKTWPDMHLLAATAKRQIGHMQQMQDELADIKTRMAEIYQAMATGPEIRLLREDVSGFRNQSVSLEVRVAAIESHLGLDHSTVPR